jgi:hypothetical protein
LDFDSDITKKWWKSEVVHMKSPEITASPRKHLQVVDSQQEQVKPKDWGSILWQTG